MNEIYSKGMYADDCSKASCHGRLVYQPRAPKGSPLVLVVLLGGRCDRLISGRNPVEHGLQLRRVYRLGEMPVKTGGGRTLLVFILTPSGNSHDRQCTAAGT